MSDTTTHKMILPCGGRLVDLVVPLELRSSLFAIAKELPSIQLSERSLCDLELLATGAFSPLDRFMSSADYARVLDEMRLSNGHLFPISVTLPVGANDGVQVDSTIALRNSRNEIVATMVIEEIYEWDLDEAASAVFGTFDLRHPLVAEMHGWGKRFISGPLQVLEIPRH